MLAASTSATPWIINLILEQPLTEEQAKMFRARLKVMKFYDGAITGELDEATPRGVGSYPILPTLAPFAAAFGYPEDRCRGPRPVTWATARAGRPTA